MKIVINGRFSSLKTGTGRVLENYLKVLQHIDKENEYFIYVNREFKNFIQFDNLNFHLISNNISAKNMILNHLWTVTFFVLNVVRHRADLVILPGITLYFVKLAPVIYFQHDLIEYHIPNQKKYKLLFRKITFPISLRLADKIVAVSQNTIEDIRKVFRVPEAKIVLIYNGVDQRVFRPIPIEEARKFIKHKYGIIDEYILYVGTLTLPQKNLLRLVDAFRKLRDRGRKEKLLLVGGIGKDAQLIYERVKEMGLRDEVVFTGYVEDEDLPFFYSAASVFCFPSIYEGFGLPVLEAMSCGCPVVTSRTSSLPEVAGDAALLTDPLDVGAIADTLFRVLNDDSIRNQCIQKGLEQAGRFQWEDSGKKLLKVINGFRK